MYPRTKRTILIILCAFAVFLAAHAAFGQEWSKDPKVREWYNNASLTPAAHARLGYSSCCKYGDVVRTQFRVNRTNGQDEWWYLAKEGWKEIPPDIIHPSDKNAPDGRPTLFIYNGTETCFFVGRTDL